MKTKVINKEVPDSILETFAWLRSYANLSYKGNLKAKILTACDWFDSLEEKEVEDTDATPSSPYEFEVGDLVEVQGHPSGDNALYYGTSGFIGNEWVKEMDEFIGTQEKVKEIFNLGVDLSYGGGWTFPPQSLKLINKAK